MITSTRASEQPLQTIQLHLADAAATARAGAAFAPMLSGGMIVTLQGDLGSGKTTLVRGVLRARGQKGPIKSPSYGLVEHYPFSSIYFYHIDFYRIEWPEHAGGFLPRADVALVLALAPSHEGRTLRVEAYSASGERCLNAISAQFIFKRPLR